MASECLATEALLKSLRDMRGSLSMEGRRKADHILSEGPGAKVPFSVLRELHTALREEGSDVYLHELLQGSEIYLPAVKVPERVRLLL